MPKHVLWNLHTPVSEPPVYESDFVGWQTIVSGSVDFQRSGLVSVRWELQLAAEESFAFGFLRRRTENFEFRLELGGVYVYSYKPPQRFEAFGAAAANVAAGPMDMFVMIHLPKNTRVVVSALRVEILE